MREKSEYISVALQLNYFLVGFQIHLLSNLMTGGYYLEQCQLHYAYTRDEDAPLKIPDPNAVKPEGWLDDGPEYIPDPEAAQPDDW